MDHHMTVPEFLALLVAMLGAARLFGACARKLGQPAVLGELVGGVIVGKSLLGWVDPSQEVVHLMGELGVIILLFTIGIETDLRKLLSVGPASFVVACAGVAVPFLLGYLAVSAMGATNVVAIFTGAALTATSVGITARVLSDLGRLQTSESQVILGAAVLDDVMGLVILSLVASLAGGKPISLAEIAKTTGLAFGFLIVVIGVGSLVVPWLANQIHRKLRSDSSTIPALIMALGLAWLADKLGSALILGAFAGGMLLVGTPQHEDIEKGLARLGHFFVPIFFVSVGAAVDLSVLNPLKSENHATLVLATILVVVGIAGKLVSGYAAFWFKGDKKLIGVGMIPRGEVGLIFAQMGLTAKILNSGQYAAIAIVVMITTFVAPPWLKYLLSKEPKLPPDTEVVAIGDLVGEE